MAGNQARTLSTLPWTASALGEDVRPGRNDDIARAGGGLPKKPRESGSDRRLVAQITHEPSRKRPVPLPRLGHGC